MVRDNSLISRNEFIAPCVGQTSRNILLLCFFEGYVRTHVFQRRTVSPATWMPRTKYLPLPAQYDSCSPTNNDTLYTHKRLQGQVADGNCYASGGLCGHAGVFTTAPDVGSGTTTRAEATFLHIGYRGTCMCGDAQNNLWSVVLTNRVYNCEGQSCPTPTSDAVKAVYKQFNSEAVRLYANPVRV